MRVFSSHNRQQGLTLIETLVASGIFVAFSIAIYQLYANVFTLSRTIRIKTMMTEIAGEQFEFIRNLNYANVGTVSGIPSGIISPTQSITRNGVSYQVATTIRNIDDPADGVLDGTPEDLSPADNKLVEIAVTCTSCTSPVSVSYTSVVAPKNLETENGNGALVIKAIDADGQPLADASVHIVNSALSPAVDITDATNATGVLTIVDAPPSTQNYEVTVTKNGYSTERTYTPGAPSNPNPVKPHLTVAANTITQSTFAIDRVSTIDLVTQSATCEPIGNIMGTFTGTKLIGTSPDVVKNYPSFTTSGSGHETIDDVEWDTYGLDLTDSAGDYDIVGVNPILPLSILPGTNQTVTITLAPNDPRRLVVAVVDSAGLPLANASVTISGPSGTFSDTTNIGSVSQTDWSGGSGQDSIGDWTRYLSSSSISTAGGSLSLAQSGVYLPSGSLTSSTIDLGAAATFYQLSWLPVTQPGAAGASPVKFQIATSSVNDETAVWNFVGPDGTSATYYTANPSTINIVHNGNRYLRYKVFLSTADTSVTPTLTDVAFTYTSGCLPPGQVDVGGLTNGTYHITVSKSGFTTVEKDVTITADDYEVITLTP